MNAPSSSREHDSQAHFEAALRADLRKRRWLRVHVTLIGIITFLSCWGISSALLHLGVHTLAMRHAGALLGAYGVYLLLLWMWSHYLLSRDGDWDLTDVSSGVNIGPGSGSRAATPAFRPGSGDFGGGGASSVWAEGAAVSSVVSADSAAAGSAAVDSAAVDSTAVDAAASGSKGFFSGAGDAVDALGSVDEGTVIAIPIAIVIGVAMLLATAMGFAVFGLFGIEVLMGVAVEIAFASAGGAIALKARRDGWMSHAIRRTAGPMAAVLVASVLASLLIAHWLPDARTLPDALRLIMQAF
jgi:hypothetical protein